MTAVVTPGGGEAQDMYMGWYSCFFCPREDYTKRRLSDVCPTCGRRYSFPLDSAPRMIGEYRVVRALSRGFYAATYLVEKGPIRIQSVLKVTPKTTFDVFRKDFQRECEVHYKVSRGSEHIVDLRGIFSEDVTFDGVTIACHVAELEYIEGTTLATYIAEDISRPANTITQIAIDLLKICDALHNMQVYHNDLHGGNIVIQSISPERLRPDAIDRSIRAVAIDLGSVADDSKSYTADDRLGDLQWIARHLDDLTVRLRQDPDAVSDFDYRVASSLSAIAQSIAAPPENQRTPTARDYISQIEQEYYRVARPWAPWREPLVLKTLDASYNAQTMYPWHVPRLLVDPDEQWLSRVCSPGPQVITGMRGCGKTMLLRALQFHARAAQRQAESNEDILARLESDNYVALFVSAQRLLDSPGWRHATTPDPFVRLFVAYGLEAVRAILHLTDLDENRVLAKAHLSLESAIGSCIGGFDETVTKSAYELEQHLLRMLISLSSGDDQYTLQVAPAAGFVTMAEAIQRCSPTWGRSQVLFLLDDVSTRYLDEPSIDGLLSELLFQDPVCAFKITSEAHTIEPALKSPGGNHPARVGRDLAVFDLGGEVYEKIKASGRGNGRHFVETILTQRLQYFGAQPAIRPSDLLGDVSLEQIALDAGSPKRDSAARKSTYRGVRALAGMCVGDIGEVIILYERILSASGRTVPVAADIQSACFQDFCVRRLYDLNRRGGYLKSVAKSFAEASHWLLVQSCRESESGKIAGRSRQYLSLYVRVTAGDVEWQTERLKELIDAGVFVFAGGLLRTKTRDSSPMQQFKLTYRKIYGLGDFIGLAERDRFELSGRDLEEWLKNPDKEILLRNRGSGNGAGDEGRDNNPAGDVTPEAAETPETDGSGQASDDDAQIMMFEEVSTTSDEARSFEGRLRGQAHTDHSAPMIEELSHSVIAAEGIDTVIAGLGFEERTSVSVRRLCDLVRPSHAMLVAYGEEGRRAEIQSLIEDKVGSSDVTTYDSVLESGVEEVRGRVIVDVTGLAKPVIFHAIRNELRRNGTVCICRTGAKEYYPLEADLESMSGGNRSRLGLDDLHDILTGERGPYQRYGLVSYGADDTRQRVICAFASAKHERLLALLDEREYDRVEIVAPPSDSYRSTVARIAASVAARNSANSAVTDIGSSDLAGVVEWLIDRYRLWSYAEGLNFELGLTGSKLQAVACAAVSAVFKVSQCWYVQPKKFDSARFTKGVGRTRFYKISVPTPGASMKRLSQP